MTASFSRISARRRSRLLSPDQIVLSGIHIYTSDLLNLWFGGLDDTLITFGLASFACFFVGWKVTFHLDFFALNACTAGSAPNDIIVAVIRLVLPVLHGRALLLVQSRFLWLLC